MKLNQREQMVLKAIQDGERCSYYPYSGRMCPNAYYSVGKVGNCTREAKKLIDFGLLDHISRDAYRGGKVLITEEGKNFKCELDEPYDVWVVTDSGMTHRTISVNKYSGFLNKTVLTKSDGSKAREGNDKRFFKNREKAFDYALKLQESTINGLKGRVKWAEEHKKGLKNQWENPDLDEEGFL